MRIANRKSIALVGLFLAGLVSVTMAAEGDVMPLELGEDVMPLELGNEVQPAEQAQSALPLSKGKNGSDKDSSSAVPSKTKAKKKKKKAKTEAVEDRPTILVPEEQGASEHSPSSSVASGSSKDRSSPELPSMEDELDHKGMGAKKVGDKIVFVPAAEFGKCVPNRFDGTPEQMAKCREVSKQVRARHVLPDATMTVPFMLSRLEKADTLERRIQNLKQVARALYNEDVVESTTKSITEENAVALCDAAKKILEKIVKNVSFVEDDDTLFAKLLWPLPSRFANDTFVDTSKEGDEKSLDYVDVTAIGKFPKFPEGRRWFHLGTGHFGPVNIPDESVAIFIEDIIVESYYWFKNLGWTNTAERATLTPEFIDLVEERIAKKHDIAFYRFLLYVAQCRSVPLADGMIPRTDDTIPERVALRNQLVENLLSLVHDSDPSSHIMIENMLRAAPLKNVEAIYYFARGLLAPIVEASSKGVVKVSAPAKSAVKPPASAAAKGATPVAKEDPSKVSASAKNGAGQRAADKTDKEQSQEQNDGVIVRKKKTPKPKPTPEELEAQRKKQVREKEEARIRLKQKQDELDRVKAEEARKEREKEDAKKAQARADRDWRRENGLFVKPTKTVHDPPPKDIDIAIDPTPTPPTPPIKKPKTKRNNKGGKKATVPKPVVMTSNKSRKDRITPLGPLSSAPAVVKSGSPLSKKDGGSSNSSPQAVPKVDKQEGSPDSSPGNPLPKLVDPEHMKVLRPPRQQDEESPALAADKRPKKLRTKQDPAKNPKPVHLDVLRQQFGDQGQALDQPLLKEPVQPIVDLGLAAALAKVQLNLQDEEEDEEEEQEEEQEEQEEQNDELIHEESDQ